RAMDGGHRGRRRRGRRRTGSLRMVAGPAGGRPESDRSGRLVPCGRRHRAPRRRRVAAGHSTWPRLGKRVRGTTLGRSGRPGARGRTDGAAAMTIRGFAQRLSDEFLPPVEASRRRSVILEIVIVFTITLGMSGLRSLISLIETQIRVSRAHETLGAAKV